MFLTRKIGKLLRGKATPAQVMAACVLGALIGFLPGFWQAPGLLIALIMLLVVLNANLLLAGAVAAAATLLSLAAMPVSFLIGRALLDGPTGGFFAWLINAPVTALMGFEYYATTGGLVMGALFGAVVGLAVVRGLRSFRMKMSSLQESSERYQQWTGQTWVKVLGFVFVGGGKRDYRKLASRRVGNPVRVLGVVVVALSAALLWVVYQFASGPIVTAMMQRELERVNGATVDIQEAQVDLGSGRLVLLGFAMADPNELTTDLLRADRLEADISGRDLLRKRIALDEARFTNASTGQVRAVAGRRVGRWPQRQPVPDPSPEEKTIDDYIKQAEVWKDRLSQARQWLERMSKTEGEEVPEQEDGETLRERLQRKVDEMGYARVRAEHLIQGSPTFMVYRLDAEQVKAAQLEGATLNIRGRNLSTHPHLADQSPSLLIESTDDRLRAFVDGATSELSFHLKDLQVDSVAEHLRAERVISGGTMDLSASGTFGDGIAGWINLPLQVTLHDTQMSLGGASRDIDEIDLWLAARGYVDSLAIMIDHEQFADALVQAGASKLAAEVNERVGGKVDEALDKAGQHIPSELGDALREGVGGLLPRKE